MDDARPDAGTEATTWTLADKINHLFDKVRRKEDGKPYTNEEVAAAAKALGSRQISAGYLSELRRGIKDNPTKKNMEALAAFFSQFFTVSPAYFFDDDESRMIADELYLARLMADSGIRQVATRLGGLSPGSLQSIAGMVEHVRRLEGLDADDEDGPNAG